MKRAGLQFFICLIGSVIVHATPQKKHSRKNTRYKNVISLSLPALVFAESNTNPGAGLEYERFITRSGILSASLSGYVFSYSGSPLHELHDGEAEQSMNGRFVRLALMYHPSARKMAADFSLGPSCAYGFMQNSSHQAGNIISYNPALNFAWKDNPVILAGELDLLYHTRRAFCIGLHVSIGDIVSAGPANGLIIQLGLRIGGSF